MLENTSDICIALSIYITYSSKSFAEIKRHFYLILYIYLRLYSEIASQHSGSTLRSSSKLDSFHPVVFMYTMY